MLTFSQYIELDNLIIESFKQSDDISWENVNANQISHKKTVNGNRVIVYVKKIRIGNNHLHNFDFTVNGKLSKEENMINTHEGKAIMFHVSRAIHNYINHNINPGDTISMSAHDTNNSIRNHKNHLYALFSKRLANKIGGRYTSTRAGSHMIHTNKQ